MKGNPNKLIILALVIVGLKQMSAIKFINDHLSSIG